MLPAFSDDLGNFIWVDNTGPCWHCGQVTHFIEVNFETWLCLNECADAKWKEYVEALKEVQ